MAERVLCLLFRYVYTEVEMSLVAREKNSRVEDYICKDTSPYMLILHGNIREDDLIRRHTLGSSICIYGQTVVL